LAVSLREPLKPARTEPASSVHAPLAVSDACLATFSLPFAPQVHHTAPPALPRSAALASYGTARRQPRPRRLAPWARGAALGAGRGRRPGAAGDLLRELAVWTRLAELLGAVAAGAPPRRGGWELPGSRCPAQVLLRCCRSRAGWRTAPATTASRRRSRRRTLPAPLGRQQVRLPRDLGYTTGVLGRLQSHRWLLHRRSAAALAAQKHQRRCLRLDAVVGEHGAADRPFAAGGVEAELPVGVGVGVGGHAARRTLRPKRWRARCARKCTRWTTSRGVITRSSRLSPRRPTAR